MHTLNAVYPRSLYIDTVRATYTCFKEMEKCIVIVCAMQCKCAPYMKTLSFTVAETDPFRD